MTLPALFPLGQPGQAPIVDKDGRPTPQFAQFLASINSILSQLVARNISFNTANNPAGTTSATFVMMGLGSSLQFTPKGTGVVVAILTGQIANSVANDISIVRLKYGTGAAPANGVAETGATAGQIQAVINNANTAGASVPFAIAAFVAIGINATYWFDAALEVSGGGTATIINPGLLTFEV